MTWFDVISVLANDSFVSGISDGDLEASRSSREVSIVKAFYIKDQFKALGHSIFNSGWNVVEVISGIVGRIQVDRVRIDKIQVGNDEAADAVVRDGQIGVVERVVNV